MVQCQPRPKHKDQPFWVKWVWLVPNSHTLAGFAFGALQLATMATLHLRALHKIKNLSLEGIFISCQLRLKINIYILQLGIYGDLSKRVLGQKESQKREKIKTEIFE